MINLIQNRMFNIMKAKKVSYREGFNPSKIVRFHEKMGNVETPLIDLSGLANELGIGKLLLKDESYRLGLNAFKVLGASYAMYRQIEKNPRIAIFCSATDGNHGRAVAWMAKRLNRKAIIFMPKGTVQDRIEAIKKEGAEVLVIDKGYDIAVKMASDRVKKENQIIGNNTWSLIQDTAWSNYEEVPLDIMKGYWTQAYEITKQLQGQKIDVLFLQSGVGSWAASIISYFLQQWEDVPFFIGVEPYSSNCLFESMKAGHRVSVENKGTTIMAGLDCGSVSTIAWDILKYSLIGSLSISDQLTKTAMRKLALPILNDSEIISGESGASGLGALFGLSRSNKYDGFKKKVNLNKDSTVLVINTEGNTDPVNYQRILNDIC